MTVPGRPATSSGSVIADKRYAYAEALVAEDEFAAAADLFAQAAEAAPHWAAARLAQGLALESAGDVAGARAAFATAADLDPAGLLGASLHVDRMRGGVSSGMPAAYVAALFDQYADRFDEHLVGRLGYRGPEVIRDALAPHLPGERPGIDLGCGTGLMGRALAGAVPWLDGIDLSPAMLAQAAATHRYRHLWEGDCTDVAAGLPAGSYGLAVAADVLVYIGDLAPLCAAVARLLGPGGLFAATVQAGDEAGVTLASDLRFRHGSAYLQDRLTAAGLTPVSLAPCVTRQEKNSDVPGLVFVARRA